MGDGFGFHAGIPRCGHLTPCFSTSFSFSVSLSNVTRHKARVTGNDQWIHLVLNFIGPNEGIKVFKDGALVPGTSGRGTVHRPLGDGRLTLGRRYPHIDEYYSSVTLDEVVFLNRKLTAPEVMNIYNKDNWFSLLLFITRTNDSSYLFIGHNLQKGQLMCDNKITQ